jgi:hypothetical protein
LTSDTPEDADREARGDLAFPDLRTLSDQELKDLVRRLTAEADALSYRRHFLHGSIDRFRAELDRRGVAGGEAPDE